MIITTGLIKAMAPGCKEPEIVAEKLNTFLPQYKITTPRRILHFMAQLAHESDFNPVSENLNYSSKRLLQVFPKYFNHSLAAAYAGKPYAIASRVYANRLGNGNEASGDGWKYRGRGLLQVTGKSNYAFYGSRLGFDLVGDPDLALQYGIGVLVALEFFTVRTIWYDADRNDLIAVTRKVNGGTNGLADRSLRLRRGAAYLGVRL